MQLQLVRTPIASGRKSRANDPTNLAFVFSSPVGAQVRVVVFDQNEANITERRCFVVEIIRPADQNERALSIVWSDSPVYPSKEKWSIPVASLVCDIMPKWQDPPRTYLKKFRLWTTLRKVLREQGEWMNIILM